MRRRGRRARARVARTVSAPLARWSLLAAAALAGNAGWELAQRPLYAGHIDVMRCIQASVVDAAYIVGAAALATVAARRRSARLFTPVLVGALIVAAVGIEAWALATDRWRYAGAMPTVAGLGVSPVVQLPLLGWLAARIAGMPSKSLPRLPVNDTTRP